MLLRLHTTNGTKRRPVYCFQYQYLEAGANHVSTATKIIHIDMDAFYAAVEQRDHPELAGEPVIVGGNPDGRGVVATCSYEARQYGIHSAMPAARAKRLCPHAIFVRPRFDAYRAESRRIQAIFRSFTPLVEPLSLDEAYLDVTDCRQEKGSATLIAKAIKRIIKERTGLTASAGVSYNKFLAKLASDIDKPDGLYLISPEEGKAFIATLPVGKFHGVGRATEAKMRQLGIRTGADLAHWALKDLQKHFGKRGRFFHDIAQGVDHRQVNTSRQRKSIGCERTFPQDLHQTTAMLDALKPMAEQVLASLDKRRLSATSITLKVKYHDFEQITRAMSPKEGITSIAQTMEILAILLKRTQAGGKAVRLLGVTASGLQPAENSKKKQGGLFDTPDHE